MAVGGTEAARAFWNHPRYERDSTSGQYESWFERANHPSRPLAFWIRYTIFGPRDRPSDAVGELWAVWFDGERDRVVAVKEDRPLAACSFGDAELLARVGGAVLGDDRLTGTAQTPAHALAWDLSYGGGETPLLLLPERLYARGFPKAKALVGRPNAVFAGTVTVDGERIAVDRWVGSQNHNWGSRHTDRYAWGQVAGFDGMQESFLECATAQVRIGPLWTPRMTLVVLRVEGEQVALNSLGCAIRARSRLEGLEWRFASASAEASVEGRITAPARHFVGLRYANPPGGGKICLNTKLAACELTLRRRGRAPLVLRSTDRAAFEILDDDTRAGIPVVV